MSLVRLHADNLNKEYLTNRVYVFNSNEGLGANWGSEISVSNGGLTNNTEHMTQNNPSGPGPSGV